MLAMCRVVRVPATPTRRTVPMDSRTDADGSGGALEPGRLFLTAEEVGRQLGLRRSRVYELAAAGLLPAVRLGKRVLFPRRGLEELAEEAISRAREELAA